MQAIVLRELGEPKKLRLEEVPEPILGPLEVVVRLKAAALNHRDLWIRQGLYANIQLPIILGSDGSGEVVAVGSEISTIPVGQSVIINPCLDWGPDPRVHQPKMRILGMPNNGTYAQLVAVPAANIRPKPQGLSFEEAAALPLAAMTAYRAVVTKAKVQPGEIVLVNGIGGGVAVFAMQLAQAVGAQIVVTSGSDAKIHRACRMGVLGGVNYHDSEWNQQLHRLLDGRPLAVILDGTGGNMLEKALEMIAPAGRIVSYGATLGATKQIEVRRIFWKQLTIMGSTMATPHEFDAFLQLYSEQQLRPLIDQVFPLEEASLAHQRMEKSEQFGKIVLTIS